MGKGELEMVLVGFLILFLTILTFGFKGTRNILLAGVAFFGAIVGGIILLHVLTTAEEKWVKIVAKVFFIIPIFIAIGFLLFWGINMSYHISKNSFTGYSDFFFGAFIWGLLILVYILEIFLFIKIDKTKNAFLKILTWIVGISIYFVTGVVGAAIITPPSFGTYGTPLYKPKRK